MKVTSTSDQKLGKKVSLKQGTSQIADRTAYSRLFKQLVKAGKVKIHPRDAAAQKAQAKKDQAAVDKALQAHKDHKAGVASAKSAELAAKFKEEQDAKK